MVVSVSLSLVTKGLYDAHTKCFLKYSQKFHWEWRAMRAPHRIVPYLHTPYNLYPSPPSSPPLHIHLFGYSTTSTNLLKKQHTHTHRRSGVDVPPRTEWHTHTHRGWIWTYNQKLLCFVHNVRLIVTSGMEHVEWTQHVAQGTKRGVDTPSRDHHKHGLSTTISRSDEICFKYKYCLSTT